MKNFTTLDEYFDILSCFCVNIKLHKQPQMIHIRDEKMSILIFKSGKFRVMGECYYLSLCTILMEQNVELTLKSETVVLKLPSHLTPFNIYYFVEFYKNYLEYLPEIFPAATMTMFKPLHVNLFYTGSVIVLGYNAMKNSNYIYNSLTSMLEKFIKHHPVYNF